MSRIYSFAFLFLALVTLGVSPVASAATVYTLPDNNLVFDTGFFGGNAYATGRVQGVKGPNPLLLNLSTFSQLPISVPNDNGLAAVIATGGAFDSSTGLTWLTIGYGVGLVRTGTVGPNGGIVTVNPSVDSTDGGNVFAIAAAGGYGFGINGQLLPSVAQPGGFWTPLSSRTGAINDAVSGSFGTRAVGGIANSADGSNAVVFTNFTISLEHDCGTSLCFLESISSDGLWGGLQIDSQVGLLNLTTNQRFLLPGEGLVRGVLGGASPVLFFQSATGPRAWTLGGLNLDYASWYLAVNGDSLGFVPTDIGDARVFNERVYQAVKGSTHVTVFDDPSDAVPEPSTYWLSGFGIFVLAYRWRQSRV